MGRRWSAIAVAFLALLAGGCANEGADGGGRDGRPHDEMSDRTQVPWSDYARSVKMTIDRAERLGQCRKLQDQFDVADANNESTMRRTGHNNADLMSYIDEALGAAGCY